MSYDYANARLRAMKSRLLDRRAMRELLACAHVDDLSARLAQTSYRDDVQAALARYTGPRVVMEACRLHLARSLRAMRGFFPAAEGRLLDVLLARRDLLNLKTILRGHAAGRAPDEILEALVPAGQLDESALRTLFRERDPLALADLLRLWNVDYAQALRIAWGAAGAHADGLAFESVLERVFYERLLGTLDALNADDQMVREYLRWEIDATNLMTALRLRAESAPGPPEDEGAEHFLSGGGVPPARLAALARAARDEDALAIARGSALGAAFADAHSLSPSVAQRALDRAVARHGMAFFARDPLTIAPAIGFLAAKETEVSNVRLIAQGIALGVARGEIERDLVFADDAPVPAAGT